MVSPLQFGMGTSPTPMEFGRIDKSEVRENSVAYSTNPGGMSVARAFSEIMFYFRSQIYPTLLWKGVKITEYGLS